MKGDRNRGRSAPPPRAAQNSSGWFAAVIVPRPKSDEMLATNHIQIDTNPMSPQPIPERSHP